MSDNTNEKNIQQETEDFGAMLEQNLNQVNANLRKGDVVEGEIVSITESHIIVSLGQKQDVYAEVGDYMVDGSLSLKVGDKIRVYKIDFGEILLNTAMEFQSEIFVEIEKHSRLWKEALKEPFS